MLQLKFWPSHWPQVSAIVAASVVLWGCGPGQFQTPRPTVGGQGLNSVFTDSAPALSADGRYVVFSSSRVGSDNIYLYDRQARRLLELPRLNSEEDSATSPDISADGRYIVYVSSELGKSEVFLYDRETRVRENISRRRPGDVRNPTISPDGRYIAFETNGQGQWDIEIFDRQIVSPPTPEN
ncbi:TolB family protein [Synechococcus sp. PCC 7336]|uniref:TolB family protein n=1 Tax=Synechococcus sp. PCC 7336 TaxID=195250 RepID=UPI00034D5F83|nr:TolB family protein [Synechococcus sp. PCC 7336]